MGLNDQVFWVVLVGDSYVLCQIVGYDDLVGGECYVGGFCVWQGGQLVFYGFGDVVVYVGVWGQEDYL